VSRGSSTCDKVDLTLPKADAREAMPKLPNKQTDRHNDGVQLNIENGINTVMHRQ